MHAKIVSRLWVCLFFVGLVSSLSAQELGPGFHKIKDGIYTFARTRVRRHAASWSPRWVS